MRLELSAKLWLVEDIPSAKRTALTPSLLLATMLKCSAVIGRENTAERILDSAGRDSHALAQLVLRRLETKSRTMSSDTTNTGIVLHQVDLLAHLCQHKPLRHSFFNAGVISSVTAAFASLSKTII
ncbi:hypothetical protein B0H10DRAFT_2089637 [Mycena sp. CBHHK59/15]|nr:hypothetical protein B0H10DRAFT_2089637 [Mycena sp. CBHHK59/15]